MIPETLKRHWMLEPSPNVRKEVEERENNKLMRFPHRGPFGLRVMEAVGNLPAGLSWDGAETSVTVTTHPGCSLGWGFSTLAAH